MDIADRIQKQKLLYFEDEKLRLNKKHYEFNNTDKNICVTIFLLQVLILIFLSLHILLNNNYYDNDFIKNTNCIVTNKIINSQLIDYRLKYEILINFQIEDRNYENVLFLTRNVKLDCEEIIKLIDTRMTCYENKKNGKIIINIDKEKYNIFTIVFFLTMFLITIVLFFNSVTYKTRT
jgi:hypothetical protein